MKIDPIGVSTLTVSQVWAQNYNQLQDMLISFTATRGLVSPWFGRQLHPEKPMPGMAEITIMVISSWRMVRCR